MPGEAIIVTGCGGYIGSVLCKILKENGYYVIGFDNKNSTKSPIDEFYFKCISDKSLSQIAVSKNVTKIFHLAASADVKLSMDSPELFYHNNVGNTSAMAHNLVNDCWTGHIVFSSSAAVYGEPQEGVADELSPTTPINSYGDSKLVCERVLKHISNIHDIKVTCFRYFNVAGAYGDIGDHLDSGHIIQKLCSAALSGESFTVFGSDYPTKDGSCVRDYIHVVDVCNAHTHVSIARPQKEKFQIYNLGSGCGYSNKEVAAAFSLFTGVDLKTKLGDRRKGDPATLVARPNYFTTTTGFRYTKNSLESMITSAWEYYRLKD